MAVFIPDSKLDDQLTTLRGDNVHVCSAQPTTYAEAATTYNLATQAVTSGNYALANGDTSGRKDTCTPATGTTISTSGTATHVAHTVGTTLQRVTTCTSLVLVAGGGNTVDIGAHAHEIGDPT